VLGSGIIFLKLNRAAVLIDLYRVLGGGTTPGGFVGCLSFKVIISVEFSP
jgi:hypothetical protein